MGPKIILEKNCGSKFFFDLYKILKNFGSKKMLGPKNNFRVETFWVRKQFELEIFFVSIKFSGLKTLGPKKILVLKKNFGSKKNLVLKKFGPRTFWPTKFMNPKKLGPKSLVKIGQVIVEILLIWTNVARAYVGQMSP